MSKRTYTSLVPQYAPSESNKRRHSRKIIKSNGTGPYD